MRVIAHRGAMAVERENTLAAFEAAVRLGASEVELDVRQTRDGRLIVSHDEPPVGGACPLFEEALRVLAPVAEVHVDIKQEDPPYRDYERNILASIGARADWRRTATFASIDVPTLERLKVREPGLRLGYQPRTTPIDEAFRIGRGLGIESLRLALMRTTREWVERAHAEGWTVWVYPIKEAAEAELMRALGVDRIFASDPRIGSRPLGSPN